MITSEEMTKEAVKWAEQFAIKRPELASANHHDTVTLLALAFLEGCRAGLKWVREI